MSFPIRKLFVVTTGVVGLSFAASPQGVWLDVPFVKQQKNGCGAACVSMVMQYWSIRNRQAQADAADAGKVQQALYSNEARGILASEMARYFQQAGFRTFAFRGERSDLEQHLSQGRPLIVCLKPNGPRDPLHYVVVTGLDWEQEIVMVNDPAQRKLLKLDLTGFERAWSAAGHWTLLALPRQAP